MLRRTLQTRISSFCRELFLILEGAHSGELIPSPPNNSHCFSCSVDTTQTLTQIIDAVLSPMESDISALEDHIHIVACQVSLLKNWWLFPREAVKARVHNNEEQVACNALSFRLRSCLILLDQLQNSLPDSERVTCSEQQEGSPISAQVQGKIDLEQLLFQVKDLRRNTDLCQGDLTVLEETLLFHSTEKNNSGTSVDQSQKSVTVASVGRVSHEITNVVETYVPYVAEDEVFEATTDDVDDDLTAPSDDTWLADLQQEERSRKKMVARGKRVLSELQPILQKKKVEFEKREVAAKLRMQNQVMVMIIVLKERGDYLF